MVKANELDGDEEKRMLRQYELLKQGDVFVEKVWDEKFIKEKKFKGARFDGKIKGVDIVTKWKRAIAKTNNAHYLGVERLSGHPSVRLRQPALHLHR